MTLDKTIKILKRLNRIPLSPEDADVNDALKLGREALKAWQTSREYSSIHQVPLLPGEDPK